MTDQLSAPSPSTDSVETVAFDERDLQWAPAEPARKKRRLWLWIGVPAGLVVAGVATASALLIAPGTTVAGVPVGWMTEGAATDAVQAHLDATHVTIGDGGPTLAATDLGAGVAAADLAATAFSERPLWNVTQWFGDPVSGDVSLDATAASASLKAADPALYADPTPAAVTFDGASYVVTPAVDGTGVDIDAFDASLQQAFDAGTTDVVIDPVAVAIPSATTTEAAQGTADHLNGTLAAIGFYVGDERTVPIDAATAASWLSVTSDDAGAFQVTADPAKIQAAVDALPAEIDKAPVNGSIITNSSGTVLKQIAPVSDGRTLGDTSGVADAFAAQLASGNGVYTLPVETVAAAPVTSQRLIEVDLSEQRLYMKENGAVVDSWAISSGESRSPTKTGTFRINSHYPVQTMSSTSSTDPYWNYEVPNIQWIMYFNGSQAFHGVYWHNSFGTPMSHGCVGMPNHRAKQIYDWAPNGVDVSIHN